MINPFAHTFLIATRTESLPVARPAPAPKPRRSARKRPVFTAAAALRG